VTGWYRATGKRAFDVVVAALLLVVLSPILALLFVLVRLVLGSPAIFRQQRPGLGGHPFVLLKFRTMRDATTQDGQLLADADRLGRFGRALRALSLDELPEMWNVLKGEMSFVGPRPLLMEYLPLYSERQSRRHLVRPGITGWAQVNGRNDVSWERRFELDVWYVEHLSFLLDVRILWKTIINIVTRTGISAKDHATMPKFTGRQA
jgi:lipopolysaccharide/colanic/teichoic acid biosynthesis glycosyltransferase